MITTFTTLRRDRPEKEPPPMRIWIDTCDCDRKLHTIEKRDGRYGAYHADDSECPECEFKVEEDEQ